MKIKSVILLGPALLLASTLFAQLPAAGTSAPTLEPTVAQAPMTDKEVITELKKDGAAQLLKDLVKRGVAFEMDADIEKRLRKAKATDDVIKAVTAAGPKERENAAKAAGQATGMVMISPEEARISRRCKLNLTPKRLSPWRKLMCRSIPRAKSSVTSMRLKPMLTRRKRRRQDGGICRKESGLKRDNLMACSWWPMPFPSRSTPRCTRRMRKSN